MDNTYWNSNGRYQVIADRLRELIPVEGSVAQPRKNKALERFRVASNCYYDLYNNGLCNRTAQFNHVFKTSAKSPRYCFRSSYGGYKWYNEFHVMIEERMDEIILAAAAEQHLDVTLDTVKKSMHPLDYYASLVPL